VSTAISPELLDCLRELSRNPLVRLSYKKEQQLVALGLISRGANFVSITEAGRALLAETDKAAPRPTADDQPGV
jgi:hypothetical protein